MNLDELKSSSVIISGTMDSNQSDQAALASLISSALIVGVSLSGFPIEGSSIISQDLSATIIPVSEGNEDDVTKKRNLAIILGIIIPAVTSNNLN